MSKQSIVCDETERLLASSEKGKGKGRAHLI